MSILLGLGLGMKLLGLGGTGMLGIGARLLGYDRKAVELAKRVPPKGWIAIAVVLALVVGFFVHQHKAHAAIAAAEKRGEQRAYAHVEAQAREIERKANEVTGRISAALKDRNNAENRRISNSADALRVRGAGQALCTSGPGVAAGAGGHEPPGGPGDAALPRLSYPQWSQLLAMPFDDAVAFAEQHDLNRAEVLTWREWYRQQYEAWEKLRASSRGNQR